MALRWDPEVRAAVNQARAHYGVTVDPALVHAVIERETRHGALPITGTRERNGISYGPMQVLDSTARLHGIADPSTLAVPSIGIRIGTFELAKLLRLFPGDTARAVAAYNAGPGTPESRAQGWPRSRTTGRFVNQAYVDAVLGFWARFKSAIAPAVPATLLAAIAALILYVASRRRRLAWR